MTPWRAMRSGLALTLVLALIGGVCAQTLIRPPTLTGGSQVLLPDGSAAAPALAFTSQTGTGLRYASTSTIYVAVGGADVARFTGTVLRNLTNTLSLGSSSDVLLERDAAAVLALRNTTTAQTMRVYGTADAAGTFTNYVRASLGSSSTVVTLAAETAGTGADNVSINLDPAGTGTLQIDGTDGVSGTCTAVTVVKGLVTGCTP